MTNPNREKMIAKGLIPVNENQTLEFFSSGCMNINGEGFVVEYPSTEYLYGIEEVDGVKYLEYNDFETGQRATIPMSEVLGYWA